jgi:hypothetical protein
MMHSGNLKHIILYLAVPGFQRYFGTGFRRKVVGIKRKIKIRTEKVTAN